MEHAHNTMVQAALPVLGRGTSEAAAVGTLILILMLDPRILILVTFQANDESGNYIIYNCTE